jgi:hypothetical protein
VERLQLHTQVGRLPDTIAARVGRA